MRRGKCREMRWECAREAPALGTTFHSLALEGAGEFFILLSKEKALIHGTYLEIGKIVAILGNSRL